MLSRLIKGSGIETQPVAFQAGMGRSKSQVAAKAKLGEMDELRLRVAELQQLVDQKTRLAYEEGWRAAEAAGRESIQAEIRTRTEQLTKTISELSRLRSETICRAESDMVKLTLAISRRILHRQASLDPKCLADLIKAALEKLQAQEVYRVRVNPDHEAVMKSALEQCGRGQTVTVVPDPTQPLGGAVFETGRGLLDASLDTQIDEIERVLTDQMETRS